MNKNNFVTCPTCAHPIHTADFLCGMCNFPISGAAHRNDGREKSGSAKRALPSELLWFALAVAALVSFGFAQKHASPLTTTESLDTSSYVTQAGSIAEINNGVDAMLPVASNVHILGLVARDNFNGDTADYKTLVVAGQAFFIPSGTTARLLHIGLIGKSEILIKSGPHTGQTGWILSDWLQKRSYADTQIATD